MSSKYHTEDTTETATDRVRARINREISRLVSMVDFLAEHGDLLASLSESVMTEKMGDSDETPYIGWWTSGTSITITAYGPNQRDTMRIVRRAIGGTWDKHGWSDTFTISRRWGGEHDDDIYVSIQGDREQVCQRVVVGTETITRPEVEYQPERTEIVEKVEWVCGNLLSD